MEAYYCPSCGKKQTEFTVSLGGLFHGQEENVNNFYTELSFLQDGDVVLDLEKVKKCEQLRILSDDEYISDNLPSETDIQSFSQMADFELNPDDSQLRAANEKKYLWVHNLVTLIREAVEEDNPFVQQMLSVVDPQENDDWNIINLKECFTKEKSRALFSKLTYIVNRDILANAGEKINDIIKILDTADRCVMNCRKELIICGYEKEEENPNRKHLMSVTYGEVKAYKRICPECAACISPYFGLYPQKIISFVGTPSSGKSTVIVAAYHKLVNGRESLCGVTAEFDPRSPYYNFYQDNNKKINNKLSVKKTAKGEFPSLSILLCSATGKKYVYTFVDVPGEYFVSPDDKKFDMYKLKIIGQSDIIYTVFAGEQFLGNGNTSEERAVMAEATDSVLNQYGLRCQALRDNFFKDNINVKIEVLVSKFDAIVPNESNFVTRSGNKIWANSVNAPDEYKVSASDFDRLVKSLKESDEAYYDADKKCINSSKIRACNELEQKIYIGNEDMTLGTINAVIKSMYSFGKDPDPHQININFVSSFGFYALENIWRMSDEDKLAALEYSNSTVLKGISGEKKKEIVDSIKGSGGGNSQILKEYKINSDMLAQWFLEYYLHEHAGDNPSGINVFLYNMFQRTGFLKDDSTYNRDLMDKNISEKIKSLEDKYNEVQRTIKKCETELSEIRGFFKGKEKEELSSRISDYKSAAGKINEEKNIYLELNDKIKEIGSKNVSLEEIENIYKEYNKYFPDSVIKI